MKTHTNLSRLVVILFTLLALASGAINAAITEADLSGLKLVNDDAKVKIYVKEGVDLSKYSDFMLQSVDVAFDSKWLERYNRDQKSLADRLNERDITEIAKRYEKSFRRVLASTLENSDTAKLSDTATDKTLKVDASIVNLMLMAPDKMVGANMTYMVRQAGEAELHSKMYDAKTGVLVMAIIDSKETRDHLELFETNRVRNQFEFNQVYRAWAKNWLVALEQQG